MCSIIGYRGKNSAAPILVSGLQRMEYRGYDSVGIATKSKNQILLRKGIGKVVEVNNAIQLDGLPGNVGIGHTRWATQGKVTEKNAHPHPSNSGKIAIVHNGIIENTKELKSNLPQIMVLLKKQPAIAYKKIGELGQEVGKKYNIELLVNFPHKGKIENFDMYGKQDLSFIVDMEKTRFPIERSIIKEKAKEIFGDVETEDAYMYEGKEGVKVFLGPANESGRKEERIDILPHSLHVWYEFTDKVTEFCDWLLENVYLVKDTHHKGETKYEKFRAEKKRENA